ncbi:hypothetical protein ANO11243_012390 [Dothideomycetidae sp. 11243]|nr:hypothetical protein ANO11243_012390 [fungal sp. No.11243]
MPTLTNGKFTNGEDHETKAGDATELNGTAFSVDDIEKDIRSEIADIRKPAKNSPITPIWTDVPCLVFFRTSAPVDPVTLVQEVMRNAAKDPTRKRTRCTQRFTPNSVLGYASEEGLDQVAREVLAPHFHTDLVVPKKVNALR